MIYHDLSIPLRCLIILALFLLACVGGSLLRAVCSRRKVIHKLLAPAGILVSTVLMILYTAEARANLRNLAVPPSSEWLCSRPLLIPVAVILLISAYFGYLLAAEWRYRENTITRSSIKEGVDKISSGLCFYTEEGRVILANSRMNQLCYEITGWDLQNAGQFWNTLSGGTVQPGVERLSFGLYPNFRLPDGSVWTFAREELDGFIQLTAADTTLQQSLTEELCEKNLELEVMNLRLRRYGENVDELARARERLETKVRIHGELGQALMATRSYLVSPGAQEPPLDVWRRNIAMLRKEMEARKEGDPLQILRKAAQSAGITLHISGTLPEKTEQRQFFLTAASEAMTNAVFHAKAKTLFIELNSSAEGWRVRFTNDGIRPAGPVTEGGGLGSLRRKAEYIGAVMAVECEPEFALTFEGIGGEAD